MAKCFGFPKLTPLVKFAATLRDFVWSGHFWAFLAGKIKFITPVSGLLPCLRVPSDVTDMVQDTNKEDIEKVCKYGYYLTSK